MEDLYPILSPLAEALAWVIKAMVIGGCTAVVLAILGVTPIIVQRTNLIIVDEEEQETVLSAWGFSLEKPVDIVDEDEEEHW